MDQEAQGNSGRDNTTTESLTRPPEAGQSLLHRLPFLRPPVDYKQPEPSDDLATGQNQQSSSAPPLSQPKVRRRRGSLRKVALLGRGAQREGRESKNLTVDTTQLGAACSELGQGGSDMHIAEHDALGLKGSDLIQVEDAKGGATMGTTKDLDGDAHVGQYTSTTDEEDILQIPRSGTASRSELASLTPGSDSYFGTGATSPCSRSLQQAKSPLSYSGISSNPLPQPDADWDYSETEWWGWVVLSATWFVFVVGMGSCLDIWSWAWDVGKTPYAPPELEDDPTLPIVGYYPALIILTGVMAWVWVVVAWVGMKYFRHAKISGD